MTGLFDFDLPSFQDMQDPNSEWHKRQKKKAEMQVLQEKLDALIDEDEAYKTEIRKADIYIKLLQEKIEEILKFKQDLRVDTGNRIIKERPDIFKNGTYVVKEKKGVFSSI